MAVSCCCFPCSSDAAGCFFGFSGDFPSRLRMGKLWFSCDLELLVGENHWWWFYDDSFIGGWQMLGRFCGLVGQLWWMDGIRTKSSHCHTLRLFQMIWDGWGWLKILWDSWRWWRGWTSPSGLGWDKLDDFWLCVQQVGDPAALTKMLEEVGRGSGMVPWLLHDCFIGHVKLLEVHRGMGPFR